MTTDTRTLIEEAKAILVSKPKATKANTKAVESADPIVANELMARLSTLQMESKILKAQEDEIKAILRDAIGTNDELLINGAKVASISRWREFGLVTDTVKTTFPIAEYPELYKAATKSRLNVH